VGLKVNVAREGRYVPKWEGNRDEPESEQIVVEFGYLSFDQRKKFIRKEKPLYVLEDVESKTDEQLDEEIESQRARVEIRVDTDDQGIIKAMNPRIANLEDTDGNAIDTWEKLTSAPATPENKIDKLIAELSTYLSGNAKETDTKN
jgi:hypothetical protein